MNKIKAIVFDCFGVLTTDAWLPFLDSYFSQNDDVRTQARDLNKQADSGFISYDEFITQVAKLASIPKQSAHAQIEGNVANQPLFSVIKQLKQTYKIGMLSNAGANWMQELFTTEQVALFDAILLSYEINTIKPDPKMYLTICERLGVQPTEAVFIDDIERYVAAAQDIGMQGIWYKDMEQFSADLHIILEQ